MIAKIDVLVIVTLCFMVGHSTQYVCEPRGVINLTLYNNHLLAWNVEPDEPCPVTEFWVWIFHNGQPAEYQFSVKTRFVDVSFLEVCEEWVFAVQAISDRDIGADRRLIQKLPIPAGVDLSIAYLNLNHNADAGQTHLSWDLTDKRLGNCSLQYRVTVEESGSPVIEDFYVDKKSIDLRFLSSCTAYQFGIRAINMAFPTTEGPLRTATHILPGRAQYPPVILHSISRPFTISLSIGLESEVRNPCPLVQLFIDGGSKISRIIDLGDHDRENPVDVWIANLTPNTSYKMLVYVSNTAGWSNATEVTVRTWPITATEEKLENDE